MIGMLLTLIFLSATLSLVSYSYCWHDIKTGRPHIISLRQITTIMDRHRLNAMFGPPGAGYRYKLSPQMLRTLVKGRIFYFYSETAADCVCLVGSYLYLTKQVQASVGWFILLAVICQAVNVAHSILLVRKWSHQIKEELEDS
jgi:hypothetical protein